MDHNLTANSEKVFKAFAKSNDQGGWNNMPHISEAFGRKATPEEKGYISDIVKKGYAIIDKEDGMVWFVFTAKGIELARSMGFKMQA
jgi:hypothetical protein